MLVTVASAQPTRSLITDGDFGPITLSIDYEQRRGDLRRATLSITSSSKENPLPQIEQVVVLSRTGQWIMFETFLDREPSSGLVAEGVAPAPEAILMILMKPKDGAWQGWRLENTRDYANMEVSYFTQQGERARSAPCPPRTCFADVVDAFNQAESTASSFRLGLDMRTGRVDHEDQID